MNREPVNQQQQSGKVQDTVTFMVHKEVKKHLEEGKRLFDLGDTGGALHHYKAALEIDPNCALIHFNLGFAFYEQQDREAARRCYEKAIELEPSCSLFLEHLAKLHFENADYCEAINLFRRAGASGEIQPVSYGLWGRAYYELQDYTAAIEQLEKMLAFDLSPTLTAYARYYLVLSSLEGSDMFRARLSMQQFLDSSPNEHDLLADLGEQLLEARCITLAKRCLERFLEQQEDIAVQRSYQEIVDIEHRVDQILPRLFSGDEERILQNIHLLFQFGSERVARALASIQEAHSPLIREAVVEYHRKYGYPFVGDVGRLLEDDTGFVREKCAHYICSSKDERYLSLAEKMLTDDSDKVRRWGASFLRDRGRMEHLPILTQVLAVEKDSEIQRQMRLAISTVKVHYQKQEKELIDFRPLQQTESENLQPVRCSPIGNRTSQAFWWVLLVISATVLILSLLSF